MWVFGYGSLIWKADFPYEKKLIGHIKGYIRRFYQKSTDHRGVPSKPGRVVTLLASTNPNDEVWGVAYKISSENIDNVVNHLDFREKGGYKKKTVLFYPYNLSKSVQTNSNTTHISKTSFLTASTISDEAPFYLTIYIGEEDNPNYAAPGVQDEHLFALESAVKQLEKEREELEENTNLNQYL
ncbi:putative glutathione-specific gamma-glutamylcyclotransferase 2 isoform X2 [Pseudomyrmex gracilis]|uniref:putative glutathione-specific gamma-glutamylcyclotransferase 2 isoform X2 n=1 Tax=Pseudomyrmex gracilis TaxID=219809 RepID=UPI00099498EA|nr:putative glutathione-specific gamma-glutamylcyclotransferase 2 isoform X2 [Pseudomyrmex gracilis]